MLEIGVALIGVVVGLVAGIAWSAASKRKEVAEAVKRGETEAELALERQKRLYDEMLQREEQKNLKDLETLQKNFDDTMALMQAKLENITASMLQSREAEFKKRNAESMQNIVAPLNEEIKRMRESVTKNSEKNSELSGRLSESIRVMAQTTDAARISADRLSNALKLSNRVQGHWGETMLAQLLSSQGLVEGVHFDTQFTINDEKGVRAQSEEGSGLRPDVVLHLDDNRDIIIDSKVSLTAYLDYVNAETDTARDEALRRHVESLQNQVRLLARKDYSKYVVAPKVCMDYVIMFVPVSAALYAATSAKPDLWRRAMEQNVYIADEQTLYAALRIIDITWRNIVQAQNHKRVFDLASEMLDRVAMFLEAFDEMGRKLSDASSQYEKSLAKLKESGQSIPQTARKLINLGASPSSSTVRRKKALDSYIDGPDNDSLLQ